jgi:hypothetical protein
MTLHVISVISNPCRYKTRVKLFKEFMARMEATPGVTLWVVEAVTGRHKPTVADPDNPHHVVVRCDDELWIKENLINIGASHAIAAGARYLGWCDGDVEFLNHLWALETVAELQTRDFVQPFSDIIDLGPDCEFHERQRGLAFCHVKGPELGKHNRLGRWENKNYGCPFWHPGYAWFTTVSAWKIVGGMIDKAIVGAADHHMACALIGEVDFSCRYEVHPNYRKMLHEWQKRAERLCHNIGYVPGTILHHFHGAKANRKYVERRDIIVSSQYDPETDVYYDEHGVLRLTPATDDRTRNLRDNLRRYFRQRKEDHRA